MKNNTTKYTDRQKETLSDIARQLEMALGSDKTPEGVRDCLKTIIINAATESSALITDINDSVLLSKALPGIIENLNFDYGRGVLHSIHAILIHDTKAFREFYDKRMDEKPEKSATETPIMSQEEMQRFISVIANAEHIQGDYVHNGFLCFFQSIYEAIKENPVEAQNLMFHLQQHVFNKLMWESFWAFEAYRKKAHSIFSSTEPYIYYEEESEEEETKSDVKKNRKQIAWTCRRCRQRIWKPTIWTRSPIIFHPR